MKCRAEQSEIRLLFEVPPSKCVQLVCRGGPTTNQHNSRHSLLHCPPDFIIHSEDKADASGRRQFDSALFLYALPRLNGTLAGVSNVE